MVVLAIDTSTAYLSVALCDGDKSLGRYHRMADMRHSTILMPTISNILKKAKIRPEDIDLFSISIGPGSFTGLRIGVTTVKGLAFSLKKPIVTVPTMDVIAYNAIKRSSVICPVLDARKGKVYACIYRSDGVGLKRLTGYLLLAPSELVEKVERYKEIVFLGDGIRCMEGAYPDKEVLEISSKIDWYPEAGIAAKLGAEKFKKGDIVTAEKLRPFYIYSKECDIKGV